MPALNVGINSTFEQQRVVINTLAVDVNSILTGAAGLSTYAPVAGVSSNTVRFDNQLPSYYLTYANLTGTPTALSDFTNDLGFVTAGHFSNLSVLSIGSTITAPNIFGTLTGTASTALKIPVAESGDNNYDYDIPFINGAYSSNGDHDLQVDSGALRFNPGSNTLSVSKVAATDFVGALTGDATGLSGNPNVSVTSLNASGSVTSPSFVGDLTGQVTGSLIGNVTGNVAGTATTASVALSMFENANVITTGIVSATTFYGDGSQLTGIIGGGAGGVRVEEEGNFIGAGATVNFVGSAVTASFANSVITVSITDTDTIHWTESGSNLYYNTGNVAIGAATFQDALLSVGPVGYSGTALRAGGNIRANDKLFSNDLDILSNDVASIILRGSSGNITANGDVTSRDIISTRHLIGQSGIRVGTGGTAIYVDSSTGLVGLATDSASYLLDINGELGVRGSTFFSEDINIPDNKQIRVGDNTDLRIYHDNVNTHIAEQGQGSLIIRGSNIRVRNETDTQEIAKFSSGAGAKLYYANSEKFETLGAGATTYGDHFATRFVGDGSALTNITPVAAGGFVIQDGGTNVGTAATLNFTGAGVSPVITNGIAIVDIGAAQSSAPGFFDPTQTKSGIHTTALHVGIGTTNPQSQLQVGNTYGIQGFRGSWNATAGTAKTDIGGWTIADTDFKSAEYTLWFNFQDGRQQSQKVLAIHDGSNAYVQQFAIMNTGSNLISIDAAISSGDFVLSLTPEVGVTGIVTYIVRRETML